MNMMFADTFFWIAGTSAWDKAHGRAIEYSKMGLSLATTEEVLAEYLNYFAPRGLSLRREAATRVQEIVNNAAVTVLSQSAESFALGFDLYIGRMDKGYSLTDCISMMRMREVGIVEVLTNDIHFEQEGFRALFRERE